MKYSENYKFKFYLLFLSYNQISNQFPPSSSPQTIWKENQISHHRTRWSRNSSSWPNFRRLIIWRKFSDKIAWVAHRIGRKGIIRNLNRNQPRRLLRTSQARAIPLLLTWAASRLHRRTLAPASVAVTTKPPSCSTSHPQARVESSLSHCCRRSQCHRGSQSSHSRLHRSSTSRSPSIRNSTSYNTSLKYLPSLKTATKHLKWPN